MATETAGRRRAHVVLPRETIDRVDALVGARGRSRFIAEAVEQELRRRDRADAIAAFVGSLADVDIPGWETPEATAQWVRRMRGHCDCHETTPVP